MLKYSINPIYVKIVIINLKYELNSGKIQFDTVLYLLFHNLLIIKYLIKIFNKNIN